MWHCPLDKRFFAFTGIAEPDLVAEVAKGRSDSEMLAWVRSKLPPQIDEIAIDAWSRWMESAGPGDAKRHEWFAETLRSIAPDRDDIRTNFDRLDLDDYVSFGGRA